MWTTNNLYKELRWSEEGKKSPALIPTPQNQRGGWKHHALNYGGPVPFI